MFLNVSVKGFFIAKNRAKPRRENIRVLRNCLDCALMSYAGGRQPVKIFHVPG